MQNIILKVNKMCIFASSFASVLHNFARIYLTVFFGMLENAVRVRHFESMINRV